VSQSVSQSASGLDLAHEGGVFWSR